MTFLQNPPPITISGQFTTSVYQMTLQSANLKEIYDWTPKLVDKMRQLPGFLDVNTDLQIASPQVIGGYRPRPRAVAGRHAAADPGCALHGLRQPPGFDDLHAGK